MYNLGLPSLKECAKVLHKGVQLSSYSPYMCHMLLEACEACGFSSDKQGLDVQEIIDCMLDYSDNTTVQGIVWTTLEVGDQPTVDKYWALFYTAFATALVDRAVIDGEYVIMDDTIAVAYKVAIKTITEAYHAECEHKGT